MHFRCIDCLLPKHSKLNHICSKHGIKITAAAKRRISSYCRIFPGWKEEFTAFQCWAPFCETQQELRAGAAFVESKQHPLAHTFRNPANWVRAGDKSHHIWHVEDIKTPLCFFKASDMAEETDILTPSASVQEWSCMADRAVLVEQCLQHTTTQGSGISAVPRASYPHTKSALT